MARYELEIEGYDLGQAQLALNQAGIPTIASGTGAGDPGAGRRRGGFFRSAAFPILLVIVIAFFAQRLVGPAEDEDSVAYSEFLTQVEEAPGSIERVTIVPEDYLIEVDLTSGRGYETGYLPETEETLINTLRRQRIETVVEDASGGSFLSLVAYVLPFLLFFAFWLFLMKRMERRQDGTQAGPPTGLRLDGLRAVVDADSSEQAAEQVRTALPVDAGYRLRKPRPV